MNATTLMNMISLSQLVDYFIDCVGFDPVNLEKIALVNIIIENEEVEECLGFNGMSI